MHRVSSFIRPPHQLQYCMITFFIKKHKQSNMHALSHHPVRHVNSSLRTHWSSCWPPAVSHLRRISISSYGDKEPPDSLWFVTDLNSSQLKRPASVERKPNPKSSLGKISCSVGADAPKGEGSFWFPLQVSFLDIYANRGSESGKSVTAIKKSKKYCKWETMAVK